MANGVHCRTVCRRNPRPARGSAVRRGAGRRAASRRRHRAHARPVKTRAPRPAPAVRPEHDRGAHEEGRLLDDGDHGLELEPLPGPERRELDPGHAVEGHADAPRRRAPRPSPGGAPTARAPRRGAAVNARAEQECDQRAGLDPAPAVLRPPGHLAGEQASAARSRRAGDRSASARTARRPGRRGRRPAPAGRRHRHPPTARNANVTSCAVELAASFRAIGGRAPRAGPARDLGGHGVAATGSRRRSSCAPVRGMRCVPSVTPPEPAARAGGRRRPGPAASRTIGSAAPRGSGP